MEYVPFDANEDEVTERLVLRPGVPPSMRQPLTTWIWRQYQTQHGNWAPSTFHAIENNLDVSFNLNHEYVYHVSEKDGRALFANLSDRELIRVADFVLYDKSNSYGFYTESLEQILTQGRSAYEVVTRENTLRLATRVPEGVQDAAESVIALSEAPGKLLRRAWNMVHDITPNDSGAYASAVKAVESAALPALGIAKETATLSDAVRAIERRGSTWRLPFLRDHTEYPSRDVLLGMLKSMYRGQRDRHGSAAYSDVTHAEAEAAVLMAVTLVGWFSGDLVQERDEATYG